MNLKKIRVHLILSFKTMPEKIDSFLIYRVYCNMHLKVTASVYVFIGQNVEKEQTARNQWLPWCRPQQELCLSLEPW